jgi:uncharacterized protein YgiM (DUF1202 family)
MSKRIGTIISTAVVLAALAAPALADTVTCSVTAFKLRVRNAPSMKGQVVAILNKDSRVSATDNCSGGWVKISSEDGRTAGYVAGWALSEPSSQASKAPSGAPAPVTAVRPAAVNVEEPAAEQKGAPTNEQIAFQVTEMRLRILHMERNMTTLNRDIRNIKATLARNAATAKASGK